MSLAEIVRNSHLFAGLNEEELAEINLFLRPFSKNDGELFFTQGEEGEDIFIINQGSAELFVRLSFDQESKIAQFKQREHFGEFSIFNGSKRTATAKAKGSTSGVVVSGKVFGLMKLVRKSGYVSVLKRLLVGATHSLRGMTNLLTNVSDAPLQTIKSLPNDSWEESGPIYFSGDSPETSVENICRLHLFNDFNHVMIDDVLRYMRVVKLKRRQMLFSQQSRGLSCYVVLSGALQIVLSGSKKSEPTTHTKVALLAPGRPVGHLSFFDDSLRSAAAIAAEDTTLLELSREKFDQLISDGSEIGFLFMFALLDDLVDAMRNTNKRFQFAISQQEKVL